MRLGRHEKEMLAFVKRLGPLGLHSVTYDRTTQRAATSLHSKGLIGVYYSDKKPGKISFIRPLYEGA